MAAKVRNDCVVNLPQYLIVLYSGVFLLVMGMHGPIDRSDMFWVFLVLGGLGVVGAVVYVAILLYRLWQFVITESLQAGLSPEMASPGRAVGRLFIPFYNFYWIFVCLRGLPRGLTALAAQRGVPARLSLGLGTAIAALCPLGLVPFVNFVVSPIVLLVLYPLYFYQMASFARNLQVYADTGRDLFSAGKSARERMAVTRHYGELFSRQGTEYVFGVVIFFGLIFSVLPATFWMPTPFLGALSLLAKNLLLAVMLVFISQWLRRGWLVTVAWALAYGLASAMERWWGVLYGFYPADFGMDFVCFGIFGFVGMGVLQLLIRIGGVRWWTIVPASGLIISFSLWHSGVGDRGAGVLLFVVASGWLVLSATLYGGFYLNVKRQIEAGLLAAGTFR